MSNSTTLNYDVESKRFTFCFVQGFIEVLIYFNEYEVNELNRLIVNKLSELDLL